MEVTQTTRKKIAVIGAGWSGLTTAVTLLAAGHKVTLFERSPLSGGRAAKAYEAGVKTPFPMDNGQHVLLGAYSETLALLGRLGFETSTALVALPATWQVPQAMDLRLPAWCARTPMVWRGALKNLPLAIGLYIDARRNGNSRRAYRALYAAFKMVWFKPRENETVDAWLSRLSWDQNYQINLWRPLCLATLNTPSDLASARHFAAVVRDGLMAGPRAATMLIPRLDLSKLLPEIACQAIAQLGGKLDLHQNIASINLKSSEINIRDEVFDSVIIATAPKDAWRLLEPYADLLKPTCRNALQRLASEAHEPISTLHLYLGQVRLPNAVTILPKSSHPALANSVLIDRSYLESSQKGWFSLVMSSSHKAITLTHSLGSHTAHFLAECLRIDLIQCFPDLNWLEPSHQLSCQLIHAKQATYSCRAGIEQPSVKTGIKGVYLAGDYVANDSNYPATLETAVRSGLAAASYFH